MAWNSIRTTPEAVHAHFEAERKQERAHRCDGCKYWSAGLTRDCGRCRYGFGSSARPQDNCAKWTEKYVSRTSTNEIKNALQRRWIL